MKIKQRLTTLNEPLPPPQLKIKNGRLVSSDETFPEFSEFPDMEVSLVPHETLQRLRSDSFILRSHAS